MATPRYYADPKLRPKLEPSLYNPQDDELLFFRKLTGIEDENELKSHILTVQAKAYEVSDVLIPLPPEAKLRYDISPGLRISVH
jgi:hypothetical protein